MRCLFKRVCLKVEDVEVEELLFYLYSFLGEKFIENFGNFFCLLYICDFIEWYINGLKEVKFLNLKEFVYG